MEEWQMKRYRLFVESLQESIGRQLTKNELRTILWLAGFEQNTVNDIINIVNAAHEYGKSVT
ncbi:hypothetical protein P9027_29705 [Bacillus thuringiensis]|uniref:hypothetical protein n=1 Tax=Bacillus thuringiensis TaxID=1428 RepID=UPI002DBC1928|nr:hypothetical protein [Bacillus thuringiensis]MEC3226096.1 hypothetical protein [Bacillus thuringiensis]MEC3462847.1 hypothetical protein [Bacillus thuringiensis]MEC3556039.1 hypothetical protein [Bacillus thuringiensis]MED2058862.1 hypothetical protein [Bacillus thuringiensis]